MTRRSPSWRIPLSSAIAPRSTMSEGDASRCLSVGISVWPPARNLPSDAPWSRETASATVFGRWYSKAYMSLASLFGRLRYLPVLQRAPDFLRRRRHRDAHPDRVGDRVHHRRRRADRAGLAAALDPERVVRARRLGQRHLEPRHVAGLGHAV